jgi:hypothetical protein
MTGEKTVNVHDQQVHQNLDVANFATLAANAKKPVPNEAELRSACDAAVREQVNRIREYAKSNPDSQIAQANKHLLDQGAPLDTWAAGPGQFSITSAYGWAVGGGVPFLGEAPLGFLYGGDGTSWKAWATGATVILGQFVLDPNQICLSKEFRTENSPIGMVRKGPCHFTATGGGAGFSVTTIYFYSSRGAYWGTLVGTGTLVGYFEIESQQLELVWQGWKQ